MYTIGPADITAEASHVCNYQVWCTSKRKKDKDKLTTYPEGLRDPILLEHEKNGKKKNHNYNKVALICWQVFKTKTLKWLLWNPTF